MAVKRYDGSAWQVVAGKGDQGTSSSIATWVKTASGGETSLSGNDDNSQPLSYTVGQELVFINGALQKRGVDYTATTGTSITGLTALVANDVVTVWTVNAFSVTGAIANTIVDNKGDILVGTGADTPGILSVGSNGQVLTADSSTGTGLAWAAAGGGKLLQVVSATYSSETDINSTTFADTGLTATITPSSTSSKIMVIISAPMSKNNAVAANGANTRIVRGATTLASYTEVNLATGTAISNSAIFGMTYLDSPSTTSSTTYKLQFAAAATGTNSHARICSGGAPAIITLLEIGA